MIMFYIKQYTIIRKCRNILENITEWIKLYYKYILYKKTVQKYKLKRQFKKILQYYKFFYKNYCNFILVVV